MSREHIIEDMIEYIEDLEQDLQAEKLVNSSGKGKADAVNKILKELERKLEDEDKND